MGASEHNVQFGGTESNGTVTAAAGVVGIFDARLRIQFIDQQETARRRTKIGGENRCRAAEM